MSTAINTKQIEDTAKLIFAIDKNVRAEFGGNIGDYVAFKKAEAQGRVRIVKNKIIEATEENCAAAIAAKTPSEFSKSPDNSRGVNIKTTQVSLVTEGAEEFSELPGQVYDEKRKCFVRGPALCAAH